MLGSRGWLVTMLAISFIVVVLMGFSDKLKPNHCDIAKLDNCARTGGLSR